MTKDLGKDNIYTLIVKLSIPAILSMLVAAIYNIVDRIFIGRVNPLALSAVGITMPYQIIQMAFVLLVGIGGSTLLSIRYGEGDKEGCEKIMINSLIYIVITEILITILGIVFMDDIFKLLGVTDNIYSLSKDYIEIILLGGVFGLSGYCLNNMVRSLGFSRQAMVIVIISSLMNIVLDAIFILVFNWGVKGASLATVLSQTMVTISVLYFFRRYAETPIKIKFKRNLVSLKCIKEISSNGLPNFYMQMFGTVMGILLNRFIIYYGGNYDLASVTIITSIMLFFTMIIYGITQGAQPIIGYNYGANKIERSIETVRISLIILTIVTIVSLGIMEIVPEFFISPFVKNNSRLLNLTKNNMRLYILGIPFIGFHSLATTYFQSIKKPRYSSFLYILKYGGVLIPLLFIIPGIMGINGIYISNSLSDAIAGAIALILLQKDIKKEANLLNINKVDIIKEREDDEIKGNIKHI